MKRLVALSAALLSSPVWAQAISGTFDVSFQGFNEYGVPSTKLVLDLSCTLTCPPSRPTLHFRVNGTVGGTFVEAPDETVGYVSAFFGSDETGHNELVSERFPPGIAIKVTAKSATCHCGNAVGEGGYVDVVSNLAVIPPLPVTGTFTARAGSEWSQLVNARPKGGESVTVKFSGAGLDTTHTLLPADFDHNGLAMISLTPTKAGTLSITATLMPYGVGHTSTVTVEGSGGTGGDGDVQGGGGDDEPAGCTATTGPLLPAVLVSLLALRFGWRRRTAATS